VCHGTRPLPMFDHASRSGFELGKFHSTLPCSSCHKNKETRKGVPTRCNSCHTSWKPGSFAHQVTGILLDETHSSFDCDNCHIGSNFAVRPSCKNCHDDKSFPSLVPGKRVQQGKITEASSQK
jgi:formate-dependent nitrite reductase cytochrome c552 subunit